MFDFLTRVPGSDALVPEDELTRDQIAEREKQERIDFHRRSVRNGPTRLRHVTSGMVRRAQARDIKRRTKKTRQAQVRNYLQTQRLAAVTRGHLQFAGILPFYLEDRDLDLLQQARSAVWLVQHFSEDEVSYAYADVKATLERALQFYGQAVGQTHLRLPADYVIPVYEEGTAPEGVA